MRVYRDFAAAFADRSREAVRGVTVGFFDGIHLGHQQLLRELREWSESEAAEPAVVTFNRHPLELLRGARPLPVLSLTHRLLLLAEHGIAATLALEFTPEIASWTPEEFVRKGLVESLGAQFVLMGFDSAWGHKRKGDFEYLSRHVDRLGIELRQASVCKLADVRVSSTLVREALVGGALERLEGLLGRRYSLLGKVVPGKGRGRTIGFPTANLDCEGETPPPSGVYFAEVSRCGRLDLEIAGGTLEAGGSETVTWPGSSLPARQPAGRPKPTPALVNIGHRPTFETSGARATVEAHLLDFEADLYGEYLEVHFLRRHRDESKFASASELRAQIERDVAAYRLQMTHDE